MAVQCLELKLIPGRRPGCLGRTGNKTLCNSPKCMAWLPATPVIHGAMGILSQGSSQILHFLPKSEKAGFPHPLGSASPGHGRARTSPAAAGMRRRCWDGVSFGMLHPERQKKPQIPMQIPQGAGTTLPASGTRHKPPPKSAGSSAVCRDAGSWTEHLTLAGYPTKYPKIRNAAGLSRGF